MIKTNGKEFKAFYSDVNFWPDGWFHDDGIITVNDDESGNYDSPDDSDKIIIYGGIVYAGSYDKEHANFETYFKKWRKLQKFEFITLEIPKDKVKEVIEFVKNLKGTK